MEKEKILKKRPYQNEALLILSNFVKNILRWLIEEDNNVLLKNSIPLTMATWSWKTFTIWTALDNIFKLKNRFNSIKNKEEFQKLNIVVLTHRIDLVNQFRDDLIYWKDEKAPILSEVILDWLYISTYHSKADESDKNLETEEENLWNKIIKDNIIFSTYQTAISEELIDKLDYIDIILIDESHNVKKDSEYFSIIKELSKKTRKIWEEAIVLPVTATPNNHTKEIFWDEKFEYWLEKYLNSEYSPSIEYNIVTNSNASKETIEKLQNLVEQAKNTQDFSIKKELIKEAEELFIEIMSSFNDDNELVDDLFERAWDKWKLEETIIFCDSIEKADKLAEIISKKSGIKDFSLSFHSKNDSNKAISRLRDKNDSCKVILSIWKLNEWIDLPKVENVVFWRWTDSETIFFQQFGRWLRWDWLVKYFDYVWWIKNFAWINNIYQKYNKIKWESEIWWWEKSKLASKFNLLWGSVWTNEHNINLSNLWLWIVNIKNEFNITKEEIIEYFKNIKGSEEESYEYWNNLIEDDIKKIEYKWFKINKLIRITWYISNDNLIGSTKFKLWLKFFFNKKNNWKVSREWIINYLKTIRSNEEESYEYLINLKQKDIQLLSFNNINVYYFWKIMWFNSKKWNRIENRWWFIEFINLVFNKKSIEFNSDSIKKYFLNFYIDSNNSYNYFIKLKGKDLDSIKINNFWIIKIISNSWWNNPNNLKKGSIKHFKEFINWIFDK